MKFGLAVALVSAVFVYWVTRVPAPQSSGGHADSTRQKVVIEPMADILLTPTHRGSVKVRRKNPFTGGDIEVFPWTMTESEVTAAKGVLARYAVADVDGGASVLTLRDGARVEVTPSSTGKESWSVRISALTIETARLLFELVSAGAFVVQTDHSSITTSPDAAARVKESDPDCVVVTSPDAMASALRAEVDNWREYVDQVKGQ